MDLSRRASNWTRISSLHLILALGLAVLMLAQPGEAVSKRKAKKITKMVQGLAELIQDNYVLQDQVEPIEARLQGGLESGDYLSFKDMSELCLRITEDLRDASGDLHFGIRPKPAEAQQGATPMPHPQSGSGLGRIEILEDKIGYLEILAFVDPAQGGPAVDAAFDLLAESQALILDVRNSRGGHPGMVAYILSYLFDGEPFVFNLLEWPNTGKTMEFSTRADLPSPRFVHRPVFVLTSSHTPSAAEGFSYHLKHLERATLVGETTAGAAHLTQMFELQGCQVAIPTGRPISPITGGNWEGQGVLPHHQVPANQALDVALEVAQESTKTD